MNRTPRSTLASKIDETSLNSPQSGTTKAVTKRGSRSDTTARNADDPLIKCPGCKKKLKTMKRPYNASYARTGYMLTVKVLVMNFTS